MMKKVLFFAGLAAAVLSLVGCNKEADFFGHDGRKMQIVLTDVETRTVNDGLSTKWVDGDALNVFYAPAGTTDYSANCEFTVDDAASNHATGTAELSVGTYDWYLLYPYESHIATPANTKAGYLAIGSKSNETQTQKGLNSTAHLAGKNLPVWGVAKNVSVKAVPKVAMKHVASVVKVNVTNGLDKAINISNVAFTGTEDVVGTYYIDFSGETPAFTGSGKNYVSSTANLAVSDADALAAGETASFYLAIKPFTAPANGELAVKVIADAGSVEKTITLEKETEFRPGYIKTLNVTFSSAEDLPTLTIADIKDLVKDATSSNVASFEGKLAGAIVTFVSGRYAFIQDETAGIVFYNSTNPFAAGQKLEGIISGSGYAFNGLKELTSLTVENITSDQTIPASVEMSLAELNADYDRYESVRVTVKGVTVPSAFVNRNTTMTDGDETLALRDQKNGLTIAPGKYDIVGYPSYYNDPQFGVWAQEDIISAGEVNIFDVTPTQIDVAGSATSAKINVTGNVAWTAEASDGASVSPASGNGEGTITVSFPANEDPDNAKEYTVFVRTEAEGVNDEFEVNITQGKAVSGNYFVHLADGADFEDGLYLIVYKDGSLAMSDAVDQSGNTVAVTIANDAVEATEEVMLHAFRITVEGGYIQGPNGKYIGQTSDANGLKVSDGAIENSISFDADGNADIVSGGAFLRYNAGSGNERFRYYKSSTYTAQKAIQLYKLSGGVTPPPAATLESIAVSGQKTVFTVGDTFAFDGKVTATYSDGSTKDVTASAKFSSPDLSAAGTQEVTVSYTENDVTKTAKYDITVKAAGTHAGTLEDPYSVADAMAATKALGEGKTSTESYYTKGIISEIVEVSADYGNATYYISDDGTTANQFKVFRGRYIGNVSFNSADQLKVGDEVVVYGKLQYYKPNSGDSEIEVSSGNYIYSLKRDGAYLKAMGAKLSATSVPATGGKVTVNVYGNVDWTATCTVPGTVEPSTGSGIGTVTVTIPENNTGEDTAVEVAIQATGMETIKLKIDQPKKAEPGEGVTVTVGMDYLAANKDGSLDDVISYTNSSDYGTTAVTELRVYKNQTFTVSAAGGHKIKSIVITCTAADDAKWGPGAWGAGAPTGYSYSGKVGTWTGEASSVSFVAKDNQVRIAELTVTYE